MNIQQEINSIFSAEGRLTSVLDFEHRPQQHDMALAITRALESEHHAIIEAPTGVGKTIAYLIPAILFAQENNKKAIISTFTKNLQEQLFRKDLPIVRKLVGNDFEAVILKGRRNYLCTTRLGNALAHQKSLFDKQSAKELHDLEEWASSSEDGDAESIPFPVSQDVWSQVCSEQGACSTSVCSPSCYFQRAKRRARKANLVILNHALFFTLFAIQGSEDHYLYDDDFVIFDEAHTLEQVAGLGIGKSLSRAQVLFAIHRLYNPKTKKGLLSRRRNKAFIDLSQQAERSANEFFDEILRTVNQQQSNSNAIRIRNPHFVLNSLASPLRQLQSAVKELEKEESLSELSEELAGVRRRLWESEILIGEFIEQSDPAFTYWIEQSKGRIPNVVLNASPKSVADSVGPKLFRPNATAILTSATLSVNGSLDYYQNRIGAFGAEKVILDTSFDFRRQMRVNVVRDIPQPDQPGYEQQLPRRIVEAIRRSRGRALILFTSTALLQRMRLATEMQIHDLGYALLVQDGKTPRHALLGEFQKDISSVLFGLDSFWMGIDVPGEALEHVVITRLPFSVPDHPLTESRMELITEHGGNAFFDYTLPEAVLKLRQGVGRLIRNKTDRGTVTILDSRILTKQYGQMFLRSLPRCPVDIISSNGEVEEIILE